MDPGLPSIALGITAIVTWSVAELPQLLQGGDDDFSWAWLSLWMMGDVLNLLGCVLIRALTTQTILAACYLGINAILALQRAYDLVCNRAAAAGPSQASGAPNHLQDPLLRGDRDDAFRVIPNVDTAPPAAAAGRRGSPAARLVDDTTAPGTGGTGARGPSRDGDASAAETRSPGVSWTQSGQQRVPVALRPEADSGVSGSGVVWVTDNTNRGSHARGDSQREAANADIAESIDSQLHILAGQGDLSGLNTREGTQHAANDFAGPSMISLLAARFHASGHQDRHSGSGASARRSLLGNSRGEDGLKVSIDNLGPSASEHDASEHPVDPEKAAADALVARTSVRGSEMLSPTAGEAGGSPRPVKRVSSRGSLRTFRMPMRLKSLERSAAEGKDDGARRHRLGRGTAADEDGCRIVVHDVGKGGGLLGGLLFPWQRSASRTAAPRGSGDSAGPEAAAGADVEAQAQGDDDDGPEEEGAGGTAAARAAKRFGTSTLGMLLMIGLLASVGLEESASGGAARHGRALTKATPPVPSMDGISRWLGGATPTEILGWTFGWSMLAIYSASRIPQALSVMHRDTTEGLTLGMFALAIAGSASYGASVVLGDDRSAAAMARAAPWLLDSVACLALELLLLARFLYLRWTQRGGSERVSGPGESSGERTRSHVHRNFHHDTLSQGFNAMHGPLPSKTPQLLLDSEGTSTRTTAQRDSGSGRNRTAAGPAGAEEAAMAVVDNWQAEGVVFQVGGLADGDEYESSWPRLGAVDDAGNPLPIGARPAQGGMVRPLAARGDRGWQRGPAAAPEAAQGSQPELSPRGAGGFWRQQQPPQSPLSGELSGTSMGSSLAPSYNGPRLYWR
ncbi:unnamed protein product [Pedinophyceae sp. YPF-701]|nr:unnamed protein product [Pedinophyceae sp. YPF-701]